MRIRTARLLLVSALLAAAYGSPLRADDQTLPERPRLENYRDYTQFLDDMAAYKKRLRELENAKTTARSAPVNKTVSKRPTPQPAPQPVALPDQEAVVVTPPPAQSASPHAEAPTQPVSTIDPANESAPPPLIVTGPEDLDYAVEKAKSFPHPTYKVTRRYNRSTAQSFPLPQLESQDLEGNAVGGMWVSKAELPADQSAVSKDTLAKQADANEDNKQLHRKKTATRKAQNEQDATFDTDQLTRVLGTPVQILNTPVEIQHYTTSDFESSAVIDLSVTPATVRSTVH